MEKIMVPKKISNIVTIIILYIFFLRYFDFFREKHWFFITDYIIAAAGFLWLLLNYDLMNRFLRKLLRIENGESMIEIERAEEIAKEHPEKPKASWDVARIKLEAYLNRNISQVRWIFFYTVIVMLVGFAIITYGITKVYASPDNFKPSVLVAVVGILVEMIGTTFLVIYKSTMKQAKDYVNVLERINAIGMSVQILESIGNNSRELQEQTKADLTKELLKLYGNKTDK